MTFSRSGMQAAGLGGDLFALRSHFGQPFPSPLPFLLFPGKGELVIASALANTHRLVHAAGGERGPRSHGLHTGARLRQSHTSGIVLIPPLQARGESDEGIGFYSTLNSSHQDIKAHQAPEVLPPWAHRGQDAAPGAEQPMERLQVREVPCLGCRAERGAACRTPVPAPAPSPSPPQAPVLPATPSQAGKALARSSSGADPKPGWSHRVPRVFLRAHNEAPPPGHSQEVPAIPEPQNNE